MSMKKIALAVPTDSQTLLQRLREYSRFDAPRRRSIAGWEHWLSEIGQRGIYEADTWVLEVIGTPVLEDEAEWRTDYPICARLRASPLGDGRTNLVIEATDTLWSWAQDLAVQVCSWWPEARTDQPEKPIKPKREDDWDMRFAYYYAMNNAGYKYTLRDLADDTGYSHGYVRQKKAEYDAEHKT